MTLIFEAKLQKILREMFAEIWGSEECRQFWAYFLGVIFCGGPEALWGAKGPTEPKTPKNSK